MNKSERCIKLAVSLMDGERFTIQEAADFYEVSYVTIWRDIDTLARVVPVAKDGEGKIYLVRLLND